MMKEMKSFLFVSFPGLLRYKVDFQSMQLDEMDNLDYELDDY